MLFYAGNRYNLEQNSCYISDCMITVVQYCGGGTLERNSIIKLGLVIGGNTVLYPSLCINENVLQCIKQASHAKKYSVMQEHGEGFHLCKIMFFFIFRLHIYNVFNSFLYFCQSYLNLSFINTEVILVYRVSI